MRSSTPQRPAPSSEAWAPIPRASFALALLAFISFVGASGLSPTELHAQAGGAPGAPDDFAVTVGADGMVRASTGGVYDTLYHQGPQTVDGTGKYYMGREISLVMGHTGAAWLERPTREREERTDLLIERMPVEPGDVVADIGAGTGFFAFPIAERVAASGDAGDADTGAGGGRVLAVDIQPEMLQIIEDRMEERGVENVVPVRGDIDDPNLPVGEVDVIYIVDAYHEFSHPREMGRAFLEALRPGGLLILLEYRGEDPTVPIKELHKMTEAQARLEIESLGFRWDRTDDYLPRQHVLIFQKP